MTVDPDVEVEIYTFPLELEIIIYPSGLPPYEANFLELPQRVELLRDLSGAKKRLTKQDLDFPNREIAIAEIRQWLWEVQARLTEELVFHRNGEIAQRINPGGFEAADLKGILSIQIHDRIITELMRQKDQFRCDVLGWCIKA